MSNIKKHTYEDGFPKIEMKQSISKSKGKVEDENLKQEKLVYTVKETTERNNRLATIMSITF